MAARVIRKDGGPAWLALFAGTIATFLGSLTICTGIFNIVFLEEFQRSKSATAWLGGLQTSLTYLGGEFILNLFLICYMHFYLMRISYEWYEITY